MPLLHLRVLVEVALGQLAVILEQVLEEMVEMDLQVLLQV